MIFPFFRRSADAVRKHPAEELYEAIVAQARLPGLYADSGLPDTLEGRYEMLALHLFAVERRLLRAGETGGALAQSLADAFAADMETVMRELGVGDLAVPKRVRKLAGEFHGRARAYSAAMDGGQADLASVIAATVPLTGEGAARAGEVLAGYVVKLDTALAGQSIAEIETGRLAFPGEVRTN
jgi:cytochrome b pre-mRNA-processing protein 3